MSELKFNLVTTSIPVTLENRDREIVEFELREMNAESRDIYLDGLGKRMRFDTAGKPAGVKDFKGMQADLISLCLFRKTENTKVTVAEIQSWPATIVTQLFREAQKLNHLQLEEAPPKNG